MINEIKRLVHETMELPLLIEETETWRNEMNDILNITSKKGNQKNLNESAHEQFMKSINEAERLKNCLQSNISILNLCAAFINTGRANELMQILSPADLIRDLDEGREHKQEGNQENTLAEQETEGGIELKTFKVLEVKKKPDGETRAWCQIPDGNKVAVFSEGEIAEAFLISKGDKEVKAFCCKKGKDYHAKKLA